LSLLQSLRDGLGAVEHERKVRLAVLPEGSRDTDEDRVAPLQLVEVAARTELPCPDRVRHALGTDVLDIGLASVQRRDLLRVEIQPDDRKPGLSEDEGERQPHVTLADNADDSRAGTDAIE
jgi:hypothetical protein